MGPPTHLGLGVWSKCGYGLERKEGRDVGRDVGLKVLCFAKLVREGLEELLSLTFFYKLLEWDHPPTMKFYICTLPNLGTLCFWTHSHHHSFLWDVWNWVYIENTIVCVGFKFFFFSGQWDCWIWWWV